MHRGNSASLFLHDLAGRVWLLSSPSSFSTGCVVAGVRRQNSNESGCFASRPELCSGLGEIEKRHDGVFRWNCGPPFALAGANTIFPPRRRDYANPADLSGSRADYRVVGWLLPSQRVLRRRWRIIQLATTTAPSPVRAIQRSLLRPTGSAMLSTSAMLSISVAFLSTLFRWPNVR